MAQHSPDAWWRIRLSDGHTGYDPGVHEREGMDSDAPPPPGPLAAVDMSHPRAAAVMSSVRNRVATWGDQGIALRRANDAAETVLRLLEGDPACMGRGMHTVPGAVARVHELPQERPLWIIGDVRGDAVALATALAFVDEADGEGDAAFVAFLGDWAGGFHGDAASVAMVLERFATHPERTLMVRGDREWCLDAMEAARIDGSAHPVGLSDMPVDEALAPMLRELASRVARVAHLMPCAVLLPDGVMLAHGALPRPARLQDLRDAEQLALSDAALRDFTLGRLHPREPVVNAGEREGGVIEGFEDFHASRRALSALLGAPVQRLVRGQDAAPEGYRWFRAYGEGRVLTLTTMADALPEAAGGGRRHPCVGRLKGGRIRVARIELPDEITFLGDQLFPREPAQPKPTEVAEPSQPAEPVQSMVVVEEIRTTAIEVPTEAPMTKPASRVVGSAEPMDHAASLRSDPRAAAMHFDRGVRLLQARAWTGARDAFREAAEVPSFRDAAALNEAVACLWLGNAGHQEALARLRELRQRDPRSAAVHFNLGVAFLSGERNPSEAMRSLRAAVDAAPDMTDAWWALGLAAAMRSDAATAASAFARAAVGGCVLPAPGSLHGVIPAREMAPALEALRGLARFCPTADGPPVSLAD